MALRIKDNIDLKELEKLGGKVKTYFNRTYYEYNISCCETIVINSARKLFINVDDEVFDYDISDKAMCFIFDLIQAGLVEKVVEE